ncbi:MAG: hypothetical protein IJ661_05640 [Lachnospiraceae bacterium]|nr:hypothetical protein [Lachnospiraceae bacterium]
MKPTYDNLDISYREHICGGEPDEEEGKSGKCIYFQNCVMSWVGGQISSYTSADDHNG